MSVGDLVARLLSQDIRLSVDGESLRCSAPRGALTAEIRDELTRMKPELIAYLRNSTAHPDAGAMQYPLSVGQEALWMLHHLAPESPAYNVAFAARLTGRLDTGAFRAALATVLDRHPVLCSTVHVVDGRPVQRIGAPPRVPEETDATSWSPEELHAKIVELHRSPFDLERGPLVRTALLRRAQDEHVFVLAPHHIVFDAVSLFVFLEDLFFSYAVNLGRARQVAPPGRPYSEFVSWQRDMLAGPRGVGLWDHWREHLGGDLPVLELPLDRPRPAFPSYRGASCAMSLGQGLPERLRALARAEKATLYMVLLAAYQVLLCRHSGQEQVVIGSPTAGRPGAAFERSIGYFVNPIAIKADVSGNPTFRRCLQAAQAETITAFAHADYPFAHLVRRLGAPTPSRTPVFQALFNLVTARVEPTSLELPGLHIEPIALTQQEGQFELALELSDTGGQTITGDIRYDSDVFAAGTIALLVENYLRLLNEVTKDPDQPVSSIPLGSPAGIGRRRGAAKPRADSGFPRGEIQQSVPDRFLTCAARSPYALAVETRSERWSYAELSSRASRLAGRVHEHGWGGRLAVMFDQGAPMVAALMAVLMSGNAYVPLDPSYPRDRLRFMLDDVEPRALLVSARHLALARELAASSLPTIVGDGNADADVSGGRLPGASRADSLAYILYTSGSTGLPKGVMQLHRNVLHHIHAYAQNLGILPADRLSLLASYSFDASVMDIFGALLTGASLHPFDVRQMGLDALADWLDTEEISIYHSTPTLFRALCGTLTTGRIFPSVRLVVLGGEEVTKGDVELYCRHFSVTCELVNGLGPTESTLALQMFIRQDDLPTGPRVPVGYPVEDTEVVLLRRDGTRATLRGEIGIRSEYLAAGYWRRPDLDQSAFLPDPDGGGRRIYRSGDTGWLRPDGAFEFVGRGDCQVKIRGMRVELGEVEHCLKGHPAVAECIVVARPDPKGDHRLVAYVVWRQGTPGTQSSLKSHVTERLPEYMVPTFIVPLDGLPLTPSGKADRHALPEPFWTASVSVHETGIPCTATEEIVRGIWREVLGVETLGLADSFFEAGGHSLLAMQTISRVRQTCGVEVSMRAFFESPTIADLAAIVDAAHAANRSGDVLPIRRVSRESHRIRLDASGAPALPDAEREKGGGQ